MTLDERLTRAVHHVADTVIVPDVDLDAVRSTARANRHRTLALGAAACAAVVVVGIAGAALSGGQRAVGPAQDTSPSTVEEWTPERTRAEGSPVDLLYSWSGPAPSGLDAQLYCTGGCDEWKPDDVEGRTSHWALEVRQGGRSALFDVQGVPWARYFDEDSILVQDGINQVVRFRLLQADGTAVPLRRVSDLAPAVPGPDIMLIMDLDTYRRGTFGPDGPGEHPYLVDDRAGTLQLLDVPWEIEWWGPNVDEFLWGGDDCRVIWQRPDGSFDHHDAADCQNTVAPTDPGWNFDRFAEWLEPGRMALVEHSADGIPLVVHASLDRGATWERIEVEGRPLTDALLQLGWT